MTKFETLVLRALYIIMYGLGVSSRLSGKWVADVVNEGVDLDNRG